MADTIKEYLLSDTDWHLVTGIFPDHPDAALTIKNIGGNTVSVFCTTGDVTEDGVEAYLLSKAINPPEIGGVHYEISSELNEKVFIKAGLGSGTVSIRIKGTVDPTTDITELAKMLSDTALLLNNHVLTVSGNPHQVTKEEVGLGNLFNDLIHDVDTSLFDDTNDDEALISLKAGRQLKAFTQAHIDTKSGNPHEVTKAEVGLGNVANYAPATEQEAIDQNNNAAYLTPYSGAIMVKDMIQVAASVRPQTVVAGQIQSRLPGWTSNDISVPANLFTQTTNRQIKINPGLVVAYAYRGKVIISQPLDLPVNMVFPPNMPDDTYYVAVNLDEKGRVNNYHMTHVTPTEGTYKEATEGDFYNAATCEMVDSTGQEIRRVYIGKVYFRNNVITQVLSVPFGHIATVPVPVTPALGKAAMVANPFIGKVKTTALVETDSKWAESRWNDQIGVIASPRPTDEYNNILIQVGQVGYVTGGASSGTALGESFITVTTPVRIAVKVEKEY